MWWRALQLGPTVRSARGHRAAAILVTLQVALGIAIAVVAVMVGVYMAQVAGATTGMADRELSLVELHLSGRLAEGEAGAALRRELVARARATPEVRGVALVGQRPLSFWERSPDQISTVGAALPVTTSELEAGAGIVATTGMKLIAGRDFSPADVAPGAPRAVILNAPLSRALFGDAPALGRSLRSRSHGEAVVVGVVERLRVYPDGLAAPEILHAVEHPVGGRLLLLVRSDEARAEAVRARLAIGLATPGVAVTVRAARWYLDEVVDSLGQAVTVVVLMVGTIVVVVLIGSVALTAYLVQRRTKEIALRRALGATRADVVLHLMVGNVLMLGVATVLGMGGVLAFIPMLIHNQDGFRVVWWHVEVVVVAIWLLDLAATFLPARLAASVPPAAASSEA